MGLNNAMFHSELEFPVLLLVMNNLWMCLVLQGWLVIGHFECSLTYSEIQEKQKTYPET
jgi:hypothetical protein